MKIDPNAPAFSKPAVIYQNNGEVAYAEDPGLTKREYLAVSIYQGMITATFGLEALSSVHPSKFAPMAVAAADALCAELNK